MRSLLSLGLRVVLLVTLLNACTKGDSGEGQVAQPSVPRFQNLLFLLIDTLRSDHLPSYGYERETAPFLARLAKEGIQLQGYSASSLTRTSVATILTGLHPQRHQTLWGDDLLPGDVPYLASILDQAGFESAAYVSNPTVGARFGFARGYDVFETSSGGRAVARDVGEGAIELASGLEPRFYLHLHYLDPHAPYRPREPWGGTIARRVQPRDILSRKEAMSPENLDILRRLYDGVIREMDREIERLFVRLEEQGELDRTLVVITADHGEEFGEHDKLGHGRTLHEEVIRVPLIFWAADGLPSHRSEVPFHHVDLLPTMLDALGVAIPSGLDGQSRWSELVQGRLAPREEYLFLLEQKRPAELALISPPWKLIHRVGGPTNLLFDLRTDPREERDLADQSEARGEMLRKLAKAHNDLSAHMADRRTADVDPDTRARIEALGYVQPKEGEPTERRIPRRIEVSEEEVVVVPPQPSVGTPRRPSREGKG